MSSTRSKSRQTEDFRDLIDFSAEKELGDRSFIVSPPMAWSIKFGCDYRMGGDMCAAHEERNGKRERTLALVSISRGISSAKS